MIARVLRVLGKGERKVVAVFAAGKESAQNQVSYLRANLELPIYLFTTHEPPPEVAADCTHVTIDRSAVRLWWRAQRELWPHRVALSLADWNGTPGSWPLKLAPLTIPFFRSLFRNRDGEFFPGTPRMIGTHIRLAIERPLADIAVRGGEIALGSALWIFAFVAQWWSPLSRFAFRRVHGLATISPPLSPPGSGMAHYRYTGREWNARAIRELLYSNPQFVFLQRDDDRSTAEGLLPAFRDPAAFAASYQNAVRGWRELLFATAPFRALQPAELTRVHAPVSPAMLVDASKLRALTVPALSSYGSNWYVLFHQAAAAGWRSYSMGASAAPTELAAVPFDEAEFVKTVLAEPELRRLAPQSPVLARGNIAQSVEPGPAFRTLPRVLIVSPYLPFPLAHGGAVRIWNLCRALCDRVDFVLACFRENSDTVHYAKLHEVFRQVHVVDIDEKHRTPELPKQVNGYESSTMRALIGAICAEQPIAILQLEYTQMAAYREAAPRTPAILVEHDLTFTLHRQLADTQGTPEAKREYDRWLRFERERLRAFDGVWTMSDSDRAVAIAEGSPAERTHTIPNGVDLERFRCSAADAESQRVLYVGSFRHLPNYLAFEELRTRIMPAVWASVPGATLEVVAGPRHTDYWPGSRSLDPRVAVHGFVENLVPLYSSAAVVVVPLPVSAGTNIKLMEALACERPVVTTPIGCAGLGLIDGRDVIVREAGPAFSDAVSTLLDNPALRTTVAASGLAQARQRFSWYSIAEDAYRSYRLLFNLS